ncbi:hypothetical protein FIV42_27850 [Persicimonas caeni]|uniref:Uncharacterized protein n=1 Tax=Persicimonas caeni TaxID=2292766 RepID=A0A4Y6Q1V9_PERCE|nr:hypothetical protein [Persicimonas caeni]QDG54420.1 hypothetical protein FIV42_27850 [Persicimonas caeni]
MTEKLRPLVLVVGGLLFYLLVLGLRGTGTAGLELMERLRTANKALMNDAPVDVFDSPHPFIDLLYIPLAAAFDNEVFGFALVSAIAVALTLPAIWRMAQAVAGGIGAAIAVGLFLGLPIVAGAATTPGPAAIVLLLWCWLLRLSTLSQHRWWTALLLSLVAAALTLSWAPALVWIVAWPIVVIAARGIAGRRSDPEAKGMIATSEVPVAILVAPVAAVVLPSVLFWALGVAGDALEGTWYNYLTASLLGNFPPVLFEGTVYAVERSPLTTGAVWAAIEFPPEVVLGAVAALLLPATERFGIFVDAPDKAEGFELPRSFSILTLIFVLGLPWALRTRDMGGVPLLLMAAPVLAILAASILATFARLVVERLEERDVAARTRHTVLVALLGLFLLPGLVSTVLYHPYHGSYYNLFAGAPEGAIEAGHPASRDDVLPIEVARSVAKQVRSRSLYAGKWRPHFEAYVASGDIDPLNFAASPAEWQARFHEREPAPKRLQDEPAKQVTWGPRNAAVFVLDVRE